ncbi:MAG: hypothetical protein AAFQ14_08260 [Cyanobacteria bacterium J06621_12]
MSLLLLLLWTILGLSIRFYHLDLKPPSSIEIATIGYSLGHGFKQIALDQVIDLDTLLAPLRLDAAIGYSETFQRLVEESTHPPLYFWLTRWWSGIWTMDGAIVSLRVARSLSAIFGSLAIPGIFTLAWVAFRSRSAAHLAAILMAFSPYGVYLAQEARHYTLSILWVIASFICLVQTLRLIQQQKAVLWWLSLIWIVINGLGIATHYFFVLALGAEAIALFSVWLFDNRKQSRRYLQGLSLAAIGTVAAGLAWLPIATGISGNEMTTWIATNYELDHILLPIPRLITWMITMVMLLPVEGVTKPVAVVSGLILVLVLLWVLPVLIRQWRRAIANSPTRLGTILALGYLFGSGIMFAGLIYGAGKDISLAARYHFVYFPIVVLLLGVALANCRLRISLFHPAQNQVIAVVLIMALLGSLTVVNDLGFQKSRRSDALASYIQQHTNSPTLVTLTHRTHSEIRELVALAFSFDRVNLTENRLTSNPPLFLLVSDNKFGQDNISGVIQSIVATQAKPLNIVGVNWEISDDHLQKLHCNRDRTKDLPDSGYSDRFYYCDR